MTACCFTGHRNISLDRIAAIKLNIMKSIEYVYSLGCRSFYCGGALGFDTLAAEAVIAFREMHSDVRLIIAVPCRDQDAKWTPAAKEKYAYINSRADEVVVLSEEYTPSCMHERNRYMVDSSDAVIAYCRNEMMQSGSASTVRYAQKQGKDIYNLFIRVENEYSFLG